MTVKFRRSCDLLIVATGVLVAAACSSPGDGGAVVDIVFAEDADRAASVLVELTVLEGSCDGTQELQTHVVSNGDPAPPIDLAPGRYGLRATARGGDCVVTASACSEVDVPGTGDVDVVLATNGVSYDCPGALCIEGHCVDSPPIPAGSPVATAGAGLWTACATDPGGPALLLGREHLRPARTSGGREIYAATAR